MSDEADQAKKLDRLRETLSALEVKLSQMEHLDAESRVLLERARDDIQSAMSREESPPPDLLERLQGAVQGFEVRHPRLTAIVNRLAEALAEMGI